MAIAITGHSVSANAAGTATSVSLSAPSGAAVGNLLIAYMSPHVNAAVTIPAGWNAIQDGGNGTNAIHLNLSWRIYATGDTSWTWSWGATAVKHVEGMIALSGTDPTTPINGSSLNSSATSGSMATTAVTTTVANTFLLVVYPFLNSGVTATTPTGFAILDQGITSGGGAASNTEAPSFTGSQAAVGTTGAITSSLGTNTSTWVAGLAVVAPSVAAAAFTPRAALLGVG